MARGQTLLTAFKARKRSGEFTSADIGQTVLDIERWSQTLPFGGVGFEAFRILANDVAIANGANGNITFNYVPIDNEGFAVTTNKFVVPPGYGGYYYLTAGVGFTANLAGSAFVVIQVIRAGVTFGVSRAQGIAGMGEIQASTEYLLLPGDEIKVGVPNRSGAAITPAATVPAAIAPTYPYLRVCRIAMPAALINS